MAAELRDYQQTQLEAVLAAVAERHRTVAVAPTGSGKTILASALVNHAISEGGCALFIVHTDVLVRQTVDKFVRQGGIPETAIGIEKAAETAVERVRSPRAASARPAGAVDTGDGSDEPSDAEQEYRLADGVRVIVASTPTLTRSEGRRLQALLQAARRGGMPVWVIYDECHHAGGQGARKYISPLVRSAIEDGTVAAYVGLTATPFRPDGRPEKLEEAFGPSGGWVYLHASDLYRRGFLVRHAETFLSVVSDEELDQIETVAGDYADDALDDLVNNARVNRAVADAVAERATAGRSVVVYTVSKRHASAIQDLLQAREVLSSIITGETPRPVRDDILAGFEAGRLPVLVNCMVLTEGWDAPRADCAVLARPTKSAVLYRQIVGRLKRPFPGKTRAEVVLLTTPRKGSDSQSSSTTEDSEDYKGNMEEALRKRVLAEARARSLTRQAGRDLGTAVDLAFTLTAMSHGVLPWLPVTVANLNQRTAEQVWFAATVLPAAEFRVNGSWHPGPDDPARSDRWHEQYAYAYHSVFALCAPAEATTGKHHVLCVEAKRKSMGRVFKLCTDPFSVMEHLEKVNRQVCDFATQCSPYAGVWVELDETRGVSPPLLAASGYHHLTESLGQSSAATVAAVIDLIRRSRRRLTPADAAKLEAAIKGYWHGDAPGLPAAKLRLVWSFSQYVLGFTKAAVNATLFLEGKFALYQPTASDRVGPTGGQSSRYRDEAGDRPDQADEDPDEDPDDEPDGGVAGRG